MVLEFPLKIASARPKILSCMKLFTTSQNSIEKLAELIDKYSIQVVAIGNGTGSREAQVSQLGTFNFDTAAAMIMQADIF